ncbi:type VII secretion-associated serine protease mycosin [Mycolicibacterium goodii]|uniref:Serine protease n=1 Tax=Mycolicibacterium goodii TaxID=134601 RepID=A0A0K0XE11_MYCGD|nr:serine protease [Mycolicibacterium goodii]
MVAQRVTALVTTVAVVALPLVLTAPAAAVTPPTVDDAYLPPAAPPAPPLPTEQRQPCFDTRTGVDETRSQSIDLEPVWELTRGRGQVVAVIDTGVARHRLLPRLVGGGDYVSNGDGTADCDGHGTIVAGIIGGAATPGGFSGVAPDATILAIRQSSNRFATDTGAGVGDVETLAKAVRTAADLGATVINISSVACVDAAADGGFDDRPLGAALAYAVDVKNVVVVAAAGNVGAGQCRQQNPLDATGWDGVRSVTSPGWYDDLVLCVGSVATGGSASDFSLAGPWVDVAAPGEQVVSLHPDGDRIIASLGADKPISGTSYAAPVVSGLVALVRSRFPHLSAREVMRRVEATAVRPPGGWDAAVGNGVIDPVAAVSAGSPAVVPPATNATMVARPASPADDSTPRRIAFGGGAVCVAVAFAVVTLSRRGRQGVADE